MSYDTLGHPEDTPETRVAVQATAFAKTISDVLKRVPLFNGGSPDYRAPSAPLEGPVAGSQIVLDQSPRVTHVWLTTPTTSELGEPRELVTSASIPTQQVTRGDTGEGSLEAVKCMVQINETQDNGEQLSRVRAHWNFGRSPEVRLVSGSSSSRRADGLESTQKLTPLEAEQTISNALKTLAEALEPYSQLSISQE